MTPLAGLDGLPSGETESQPTPAHTTPPATVRQVHERRLADLTALRIQLDQDIAERERLRARVQAHINAETALLARAARAGRGLRCSLGELVDGLRS